MGEYVHVRGWLELDAEQESKAWAPIQAGAGRDGNATDYPVGLFQVSPDPGAADPAT